MVKTSESDDRVDTECDRKERLLLRYTCGLLIPECFLCEKTGFFQTIFRDDILHTVA